MIARLWHGRVRPGVLDEYEGYVRRTGLAAQQATPGHRGTAILTHEDGESGHIYVLSLWESMEAVHRFAGEDADVPIYFPEDGRYLLEFEKTVLHAEVAAGDPADRVADAIRRFPGSAAGSIDGPA